MSARTRTLMFAVAGVLLVASANIIAARPFLVWNATASTPIGFYYIDGARGLRVGEYVLLRPDPASGALFAARGYLPLGVPLLKKIGAVAGQTVCEQDGHLSIDGWYVAAALAGDGRGRPLPTWSGCRKLAANELFVLVPDVPASLDGRYFGPSPISSVVGRAVPIWTVGKRE